MKHINLATIIKIFVLALILGGVLTGVSDEVEAQGPTPEGLMLWNTLGSQGEVESSAVGPDGTFNGGNFVAGQFGGGYIAQHDENGLVTFPKEVINAEAGTVEFWAKLIDVPHTLAWGANPAFFHAGDDTTFFTISLNGNDGLGGGGLSGRAGPPDTATGGFGSWTYEQVLGAGQVTDWHHYALVWENNGIVGVDNGTRQVAVYLDGTLNSGYWQGSGTIPTLSSGEFALMVVQNLHQGSVVFDNLKVWNYAKTDFSDRFVEGSQLVVSHPDTEIYPGDVISVDLDVQDAHNLYGLQANCAVNPTILAPKDGTFGDFFENPLIGANATDATAGTWFGGISLKNPADPLTGSGRFATLTFEALTTGSTDITCDPLATDEDGFAIPMSTNNDTITVLDFGSLTGIATFQGRAAHSNITVGISGPTAGATSTDNEGSYQMGQLKGGDHAVEADAPLYLPNCTTATITSGEETILPDTRLLGGDTNDNNKIKVGDAALVGNNFGLSIPDADSTADINNDGQINVQDLAILGRNFGLEGCQSW